MSSPPDPLRRAAAVLRAGLVGLCLMALAGCGFRPLYGEPAPGGGDVAAALQTVDVAVIADREGQLLRTFLIERLNPSGRPANPGYELTVSLAISQEPLNILTDATATRANYEAVASYALRPTGAADPVLQRSAEITTSYNILDDQFATLVAERDARDRALRQLAESIRRGLALHFERTASEAATRP
jgi:LPS-assembly lipoprotein